MVDHAHDLTIVLVLECHFENSLRAIDLNFFSFALTVQHTEVVLLNFSHIEGYIEGSDDTRVPGSNHDKDPIHCPVKQSENGHLPVGKTVFDMVECGVEKDLAIGIPGPTLHADRLGNCAVLLQVLVGDHNPWQNIAARQVSSKDWTQFPSYRACLAKRQSCNRDSRSRT